MDRGRARRLATALTVLGGLVAVVVGLELFPYHSTNHDEAVYLQQAAMLLEGQLYLRPPLVEPFHPWFFVVDGDAMYSKYSPVTPAVFALGEALTGHYRAGLVAVSAAVVGLTYALASEVFDRRTGLLAAGFLLLSPLFVVHSGLFLPYAPTTALNLAFGVAYLRGCRTGSRRWAAVAGAAVGLAFFARPYTAVLFATPFIAHAVATLALAGGDSGPVGLDRGILERQAITAALGTAGVAVALAYNAVLTGDPLVFPYQAFAPEDGLGFGTREILGYERDYTPALALRANAEVVWVYATRWVAGGLVGTGLALAGLAATLRRLPVAAPDRPYSTAQARAVLAGVAPAVVVGNVYFWGNLNVLGELDRSGDGLIATLGPYYHFDLLVPTAAFAAWALVRFHGLVRATVAGERGGSDALSRVFAGHDPATASRAAAAVVLALAVVLTGTTAAVAAPIVTDNAVATDSYEDAYAPFEDRSFDNALVFLPSPYGDWLNHPFQPLRNDPGYDGEVVYALGGEPETLSVARSTDRQLYRYEYRGEWAPYAGAHVTPRLRPIETAAGERVTVDTTVGLPERAESVSIRVETDEGRVAYVADAAADRLSYRLVIENGSLRVIGDGFQPVGEADPLALSADDTVHVELFVDSGAGSGFSYRQRLQVELDDGTAFTMTPYEEVCHVPTRCGGEAAYVPRVAEDGIFLNTTVRAGGATESRASVRATEAHPDVWTTNAPRRGAASWRAWRP